MPAPRILCRGWFSITGVQMPCRRPGAVLHEGEPGGALITHWQCSDCAALNARATEITERRAWDEAYRRQREYLSKPHESEPVDWDALTRGR